MEGGREQHLVTLPGQPWCGRGERPALVEDRGSEKPN